MDNYENALEISSESVEKWLNCKTVEFQKLGYKKKSFGKYKLVQRWLRYLNTCLKFWNLL